ncbi:RHS repeat protein [Pseudomonas brassicae]
MTYQYGFMNIGKSLQSGAGGNITGYPMHIRREHIVKRTLSTGGEWKYNYVRGEAGQLDTTRMVGPEGTTLYTFMSAGHKIKNKISGTLPPLPYENNAWKVGQLIGLTRPDGSSESYTYSPREIDGSWYILIDGGLVSDKKVWAADVATKIITSEGAVYTTTYKNYDIYGNPGTRSESGPNGGSRTTTMTYYNDPNKWIIGRLKDETFPGSSVTRTFDTKGKVLAINRDGVVTRYTYDPQGNLASKTEPGNRLYTYSNYKRGIPQAEVQPEGISLARVVDNAGNIASETNGEGKLTRYTYDGLNRVKSMTPPSGVVKTITYTPTSQIASRGALIETTRYEPFGRVASVTLGGITTRYEYDARGRRTFVSHPGAATGTRYQYDALGRVTRVTNADGTFQTTVYGPGTKAVTDERGKVTKSTYRIYGDPEQGHLMAIAAADPAANVTLTRNTRDQVTAVSQAGLTRSYAYNANGYLVSVTNPETGVTTYGRDIAGNMTTRAVGTSGITRYTYDGQNRLTSVAYPGTTPAVTNTYNKNGKLLTSNATGGNRSFAYDAAGNLIQETLALDGKSFTAKYAYNGLDQLSSVTYPQSGRVVNYAPDALGRPTIVSGYVSGIKYWPSGLIQQITYANGTVTQYGQNPRLWPATFSTQKTGGSLYLDSSYTYDGTGNLLTIGDTTDSAFNRTLGYDNINRLTNVAGFWGEGSIAYSGGGNILKQTLGSSTLNYSYDAQNRLSAVSGLRASSYGYDAYGNISSSQGTTYAYDGVPNLVCINCANPASKVEYSYDGLNHRSSVTKASAKVYEMHDSKGKQLIELDGARLTEYLYLGDKRIAQRVSP